MRVSRSFERLMRKFKIDNLFAFEQIPQESWDMSSQEELKTYYNGLYEEKSILAMDIAKCASIEKHLLPKLNSRYDKSKVVFCFRQDIACDIEDFSLIINFISWAGSKDNSQFKIRNILIIKNNIWHRYIRSYRKDLVWEIHMYPDLRKIVEFFFIPLKIIFEMTANSFAVIFNNKTAPAAESKPGIAVLHAHGADLNKKSDYFWFKDSSIDPKHILVYFKYSCWPPKEESVRLIESYNMRWVNLLPWKLSKFRLFSAAPEFYRLAHPKYIRKLSGALGEVIGLLVYCFLRPSKIMFWQWQHLVNLLDRVAFYEAFFEIYNIKVHYGLYEGGIDMLASNIAAGLTGGVDVCYHWSNLDATEIIIGKPHDIYFSWSPYYKERFFDNDFFKLQHVVYTGYPYDSFFDHSKEQAKAYRQKLLKNGAKFIVCFFDQSYPDNRPKANRDVESIYRTLLNKVITDSEFGLIVKPKRNIDFWKRIPGLSELAGDVRETGRCLFLDREVFTNEAAQAADLVVGYSIHSTPAFEAALSGVPIVICDLQRFIDHPLYKEDLGKIVFDDLEKMMGAIEGLKTKNINYDELGDHSLILNRIDSFRDGMASERMGRFMKRMLDGFNQGAGRREVLERAIGEYRARWGQDKVFTYGN